MNRKYLLVWLLFDNNREQYPKYKNVRKMLKE